MEITEARQLKVLEDENAKLKEAAGRADVGCRGTAGAVVRKMVGPPPNARRSHSCRSSRAYRRLFILLRREGERSGINRIHRLTGSFVSAKPRPFRPCNST